MTTVDPVSALRLPEAATAVPPAATEGAGDFALTLADLIGAAAADAPPAGGAGAAPALETEAAPAAVVADAAGSAGHLAIMGRVGAKAATPDATVVEPPVVARPAPSGAAEGAPVPVVAPALQEAPDMAQEAQPVAVEGPPRTVAVPPQTAVAATAVVRVADDAVAGGEPEETEHALSGNGDEPAEAVPATPVSATPVSAPPAPVTAAPALPVMPVAAQAVAARSERGLAAPQAATPAPKAATYGQAKAGDRPTGATEEEEKTDAADRPAPLRRAAEPLPPAEPRAVAAAAQPAPATSEPTLPADATVPQPAPVAQGAAPAPQVTAAATAPMGQPVATDRPGWEGAIAERIAAELSGDGQQIDLELAPEHLGRLKITLEVTDGQAQVRFVTETPDAARLIQQGEARLSESLARNGLSLGGHDAASRDAQGGDRSGGRAPRGAEMFFERSAEPRPGQSGQRAASGLVNLMA